MSSLFRQSNCQYPVLSSLAFWLWKWPMMAQSSYRFRQPSPPPFGGLTNFIKAVKSSKHGLLSRYLFKPFALRQWRAFFRRAGALWWLETSGITLRFGNYPKVSHNVKERQIQMWTSVPAKGRLPTAVDENVFRNLFHQVRDVVVELFRKTLLAMDPQPKKKKTFIGGFTSLVQKYGTLAQCWYFAWIHMAKMSLNLCNFSDIFQ